MDYRQATLDQRLGACHGGYRVVDGDVLRLELKMNLITASAPAQ